VKDERLLARDVVRLRRAVELWLPQRVAHPAIIVLVGLPGSGKSFFAAKLVESIPAVILESDFLRKTLVRRPVYSPWESIRLFGAIHRLARELLEGGYNVILDATNLSEEYRRPLYAIAEETGANAIVVHLKTLREVAEARLADRLARRDGYSDADWAVYQQLEAGFEPIKGPHYEVTGAMDISPIIDKIVAKLKQKE
jgi:hypothetical protein